MLSRVVRVGAMVVMLGLMAVPTVAQEGRRGRQGGPGGFGRGMGAGMGGGAAELIQLLAAPEVRKEVKLSDEGYAAVEKFQQEDREAMQALFGNFRRDASEADREKAQAEMTQKMKERNEKAQALLDEVLPPEGYDRLLGLHVQLRGDSAAAGELVAKKLGLSDADRKKIEEAVNTARQESFAQFRQGGGQGAGGPGNFDPEQMRARMEEMRKKTDDAARAAMSDDQKKALEGLKGEKFEFPESVRRGGGFGFGGPGGPGGPGGRGQRGGRPDRDSSN